MSRRGRTSVPLLFGIALVGLALVAVVVVAVAVPRDETPERAARAIVDALERDDYAALYARFGPRDRKLGWVIPVPETQNALPSIIMASAKAYLGLAPGAQPVFAVQQRFPQRARIEVQGTVRQGPLAVVALILPTRPRMIMVREGNGPWQWEFIESLDDECRELERRGVDGIKAVTELLSTLPLEQIKKKLHLKSDQTDPPVPAPKEKPDEQPRTRDSQ